ncbi:MAG: FecR domain-containing protein [Bacteroidales bacterium]|nr:FecR domain-containing protein [Bacteroidales bacterium]
MNISRNILQAYLEGTLSKEETLDVQLYLAEHMDDPMVRELLDEQFDSNRLDASASADKALESVRNRLGIGEPRRPVFWLAAAVLAFLLVIPASLAIGYILHGDPAPVAWAELTVPISQTREVTLPDGTSLVLNAGSRVTWPETFTGGQREIFLDGEVMATVAKDPEHPFVIHSGEADIRVHGTTFDLKSYRDATMLEVVLLEGSVSLILPSEEGKREVRMTPGDIAQFDHYTGAVSLGKVSPDGFKTFNDNHSFSFINIPLKDIAADLERSFGTQIVVADANVASQRFLAFFTNGEDLDEILKLLSRNGNLRVVRSDGTVYLYGKK